MLDAAPGGHCWSTGARTQIGLLTCLHLCQMKYLKEANKYLASVNPQNSMYRERKIKYFFKFKLKAFDITMSAYIS